MVLAARIRGIPTAITEADAHLGLANRLAAPLARRVFLSYAIGGRDGAKYRVVGRPIPQAHLGVTREDGRSQFGFGMDDPVIAVFGGLAGAQALNEFAASAFGANGPAVLHIAGERDYPAVRSKVARADYVLLATTDHFGAALAAPDLAISRAGGTVWELAAAGVPAILVPYPFATADHQALNARHFEQGWRCDPRVRGRAGSSPRSRRRVARRPGASAAGWGMPCGPWRDRPPPRRSPTSSC